MSKKSIPLEERFWPKVDKRPHPKGCWLWTGATGNYGYGVIGRGRRGEGNARAHVLSYEWAHGPVPTGLFVLHSCDNPACVNPDHLSAGTQKQNVQEAVERGRFGRVGKHGNSLKGERHPRAKLTNEDVKDILAAIEYGASHESISRNYDVCRSTISKISRKERYKEVRNGA